jgi:hypothetical protein
MNISARDRFIELLRTAVRDSTFMKATLGKYRGADETLRNLFLRPVTLKTGPHVAFVWRHATRDVTKNFAPEAALAELERLIGTDFLDAHLFTSSQNAQLETRPDGSARIKVTPIAEQHHVGLENHDRQKAYLISSDTPWLRALGITNDRGQPREGMADKFRQIQKFAELLAHLLAEAGWGRVVDDLNISSVAPPAPGSPLHIVDMGSGKGYLTFAVAALLGDRAKVQGIEARPALVELCNQVAADHGLAPRLSFTAGTIADASLEHLDVLIALHACDTATDDALARGIAAGARLLVVAPCCQKEIRPQLKAPPVLADALQHGIFLERQAEFATDALRAQLLESAGYRTKVFEFISTEHTAKNLMIAGIKQNAPVKNKEEMASRIRAFSAFYGIRTQRLAQHLGFSLAPIPNLVPETTP